MKALTLHQPWASLVAAGVKPYEYRSWLPARSMIGQRIAIHAGLRRCPVAYLDRLYAALCGPDSYRTGLNPDAGPVLSRLADAVRAGTLPYGAVIATAKLGGPISGHAAAAELGGCMDPDEPANWAWPMLDVRPLPEPIPAKGARGMWDWVGSGVAR